MTILLSAKAAATGVSP